MVVVEDVDDDDDDDSDDVVGGVVIGDDGVAAAGKSGLVEYTNSPESVSSSLAPPWLPLSKGGIG